MEKTVFAMIVRAAETGRPCPSNGEIAGAIGANSVATAARWIGKLEKVGLITVERGTSCRVVTIKASGKRTAGIVTKPHWRLSDAAKAQAAATATRMALSAKHAGFAPISTPTQDLVRVDRDPCFMCGARGDFGCPHRRAA